ncbi:MAG: hypothetical protein KAT65_21255, partial [Methanophagales archaeon]|nr:hypothetical protein [Methanophagales archaeon]
MKEGEMYRTVKNFLINKKSCSDQRTWFTYEDGAEDGKKLSLNLYGGEIEPDVYGVDEEKDIIYLAEGKKDYRGRSLDEAIIQGVSYQRFAHYVYLFFPKHIFEEEDAKDMLNHAKDLCKKNNLGLLFTEENENKEPKVEIEPKLSKFYGDEIYWKDFRKNAQETKGKIDKLLLMGGEKKVGNVHLPIIRDVCNLLGEEMEWKKEIFIHHLYERTLKIYRNKGKDGEISSLACYDWRYKNPLLRKLKGEREKAKEKAGEGEIKEKFEKIVEEAIKTLIYFGLCEREEGKIKLTPEGVNLKKTIEESDKDNLYTKNLSDSAIRIF